MKEYYYYHCNECKAIFSIELENYNKVNFCPICGNLNMMVFDKKGDFLSCLSKKKN
jgi:rRNA maturation endonuclease Nob1